MIPTRTHRRSRSTVKWRLAAVAGFCLPTPACAIPSPELIVGALSGLSQIGAVIAAMLGGGAALALRRRGNSRAELAALTRRFRRTIAVLGLIALCLAGLNAMQWVSNAQSQRARLESTLTRPSRLPGQPALDPTLKELNYAQQSRHRLGMTTAQAEALIVAGGDAVLILDIRETAEVAMGTFVGARAIRFPDLAAQAEQLRGKRALLICHNGNRSSETCQTLAEQGIDCRFIAGGLEKWIVEGRTAGGFSRRSLADVRALPDFPNAKRLLDTPEVMAAVRDQNAVFVDLRYPGEFAAGHLPGAINLPMRSMTSPALATALAALPERPVIVPCYDRRSCFFGEVLGEELSRRGRVFLGRYTVPWEYFTPNPPPPHIAAAMAQANRGSWDRAADWLSDRLRDAAHAWGFLTVIAGLALLWRLMVLPFSLKSERDQIAARHIVGDVAALKKQHAEDPVRLSRALGALYERAGMTPGRNQLALLLLPVLALSVTAVGRAAEGGGHRLLWITDLGSPDPHYALPGVFAALFAAYIHWSLARTIRHVALTWLVAGPALGALGAALPAASALYLVASALLLLAQRALVVGLPMRAWRALERGLGGLRKRRDTFLPLDATAQLAGVGNKARRLGALAVAGVAVPEGVVLDTTTLSCWQRASGPERDKMSKRIVREVGGRRFAVRSSGAAEDGAAQSFAGVFESVLDVSPRELPRAIDRVLASFASARAASYAGASGGANIIVQRMVEAEHAGVIFTRAPDAAGQMLVELVEGTGDALVSGLVTPQRFRVGRISAAIEGRARAPIDLGPLVRIAQRAEMVFARPQDIEWTYAGGQFLIVQSRDITVGPDGVGAVIDRHWCAALTALSIAGPSARLVRNEIAELLPRPTPISLSLMERLYASGGSVDLACRTLGLSYGVSEDGPAAFVSVQGRLYASEAEAKRRAPRLSRLDVRRLRREANGIATAFEERFAPDFLASIRIVRATDLDRLATPDLMDYARNLVERYVTTTHVEAEIINLGAELLMAEARRRLAKARIAATDVLHGAGETMIARTARASLAMAPCARMALLGRDFGHRAVLDYELAMPRYSEDPTGLEAFAASQMAMAKPAPRRTLPDKLADAVEQATRFQTLKEDAKHIVLMELAEIRRSLVAIDRRFALGGSIFHLSLDEALALDMETRGRQLVIALERQAAAEAMAQLPSLPPTLTLPELERATWSARPARGVAEGALQGERVAGRTAVEGRALCVPPHHAEAGLPLEGFRDGDIIVTTLVHPAWLPFVLRSGGVVSETGGWLSHMAIIARERDIAMIVGASGLERIAQGARLRLHLDGHIEVLDHTRQHAPGDDPRMGSLPAPFTAALHRAADAAPFHTGPHT